jgi:hypothetical protein
MKRHYQIRWLFLAIFFWLTLPAAAADFDGSQPLLCSVVKVLECDPLEGCSGTTPEEINLPQFLKVDVKEKRVGPARPIEGRKGSEIKQVSQIGGKLIIQGADSGIEGLREGLGWTAAISEETGRFILTASGEEAAFVVFGACLPVQ